MARGSRDIRSALAGRAALPQPVDPSARGQWARAAALGVTPRSPESVLDFVAAHCYLGGRRNHDAHGHRQAYREAQRSGNHDRARYYANLFAERLSQTLAYEYFTYTDMYGVDRGVPCAVCGQPCDEDFPGVRRRGDGAPRRVHPRCFPPRPDPTVGYNAQESGADAMKWMTEALFLYDIAQAEAASSNRR